VPLMLLLGMAVALVPVLNWKRTPWQSLKSTLTTALPVSAVLGGIWWYSTDPKSAGVFAALIVALWIIATHLVDLVKRLRGKGNLPLAYCGMTIAHIGFAVSVLGIAITATQSVEEDVRMAPNEVTMLGSEEVRFLGVREVQGPNYVAQQGVFLVTDGSHTFELRPEKRRYLAGGNIMTEAGINAGLFADTYISLGESLGGGAWAVRLHYKPMVRWIWLGALMFAFGGMLAVMDGRYRKLRARRDLRASAALGSGSAG